MRSGIFSTPRPVPRRLPPALAAAAVLGAALPVFALADWPLAAWALGATLWVAGQALSAVLARLRLGADNLAASGVVGIAMTFRAIAVGIVLIAVAVTDATVGIAAALLYALAYTVELGASLGAYFGGSR